MTTLATSGLWVLGDSTCVTSGSFHQPSTALDAVSRSQPIEHGVLVIKGKNVSGRIGIDNNTIITGAAVDGTGETGTHAVCKLLLLPFANYSFRHAIHQDVRDLSQEIAMKFDEIKSFLSGPSSIGLATPSQTTLENLKAQSQSGFNWESTRLKGNWENNSIPPEEWGDTMLRSASKGAPGEEKFDCETGTYDRDCTELISKIEKKNTVTLSTLHYKHSPTKSTVELVAGPLPFRKEKREPIKPVYILVGAAVVFILGAVLSVDTWIRQSANDAVIAAEPMMEGAPHAYAQGGEPAPEQPEVSSTAPYALPGSPPPASPPPNPTPAAAPEETAAETEATEEPVAVEQPQPARRHQAYGGPAAPQVGQSEVTRWTEAVRKHPADAEARRQLAQAYLLGGDTNSSIEQFHAVMRLRGVDASEIIAYADNLMAFGSKDVARQFLSNILRADPGNSAIRGRLSELNR
ncbi:MAG: hypothetical protein K2X93_16625 [Candidatus Obscuribacterales bacterium]|nr:hypothetical protein [Candidatus Obscuribacterales bacterium]